MDGVAATRAVLAGNVALTALVPASRMVGDDALPQGTVLPAILLKFVSGADLNIPNPGATVFRTDRIQVEGHAANGVEREQIMDAIWKAMQASQLPTASSLTIHTEPRGPNILSNANVRVGIQDCKVTYPKER